MLNTLVCGAVGDGEVWITDEEAERIAAHLGLSLQRFFQQYTRAYSKVQGFKLLRAQNNPVSASDSWLGPHQDPLGSCMHCTKQQDKHSTFRNPVADNAGCSKMMLACDMYSLTAWAGQQGSKKLKSIMLHDTLKAWCEHVVMWQCLPGRPTNIAEPWCMPLQTRDCIFLQPDSTCSIHKVRPLQCSTYPW